MGLEELLGRRGMGGRPGPEAGLGGLLMSLLASKMGGGPCGDPEGAEGRNCDECPMQGVCPLESLKRAMGGNGACSAEGVKPADLLIAEAKIAGLETEVELLGKCLTQFRKRVDEMAAAHKTEIERLTSRHKAETESLSQILSDQQEGFREERIRNRQAYGELHEELQAALGKIDAAQATIASNGHGRPPRGILVEIRNALGMPPLEKPKKAAALLKEA